jgi:hypothetical protein
MSSYLLSFFVLLRGGGLLGDYNLRIADHSSGADYSQQRKQSST